MWNKESGIVVDRIFAHEHKAPNLAACVNVEYALLRLFMLS